MSGGAVFRGPFAADFTAYLSLKRSLGRKLINGERVLLHLDRFLCRTHATATELSVPVLEEWMAESPQLKPQSRAVRLSIVRQYCLYRRRTHPAAFVPDRNQHRSLWPVRVPRRMPFIYSTEQVRCLLRAALALRPTPFDPLRPRAMFTFLLLLYTAGLRVSEAERLTIGDIDFDAGTLRIREAKFFKTRLVPLAPDVLTEVRTYVTLRETSSVMLPSEHPLFSNVHGQPYAPRTLANNGLRLLRTIGLKPARGRAGPRLHDLRHAFASHRIARWYEQGNDVQSLLPVLATYMGHKDIASTQYYTTITSDTLAHASHRFERHCAPPSQGVP